MRSLTEQEKEAERRRWHDRRARGDEAKKYHVNQERAVHAAAWKAPEEVMKPVTRAGLLSFGKYKGKKTFEQVLSEDRGYLAYCGMVKNKEVIDFLQEKGLLACPVPGAEQGAKGVG